MHICGDEIIQVFSVLGPAAFVLRSLIGRMKTWRGRRT